MDGRAATTSTEGGDGEFQKKRKLRDAGAVLARKRLANIAKHSAYMRKWTGIINNAEKNKLQNCEKQMLKNQRITDVKITRYKEQLKQELYEMRAEKRALHIHSVLDEKDEAEQRKKIERYAARGRYLYAIRNETKAQKEGMESYSERNETVRKMLAPARKESVTAMTNCELMGSADPANYFKVGRRLSKIDLSNCVYYSSDEDEEDDTELVGAIKMSSLLTQQNMEAELSDNRPVTSGSSTPSINLNKLRQELGSDLRKQLDAIFIDDPEYQMLPLTRANTASADSKVAVQLVGEGLMPPVSLEGNESDGSKVVDETSYTQSQEMERKPKLKLPPLKADKSVLPSLVARPTVAQPGLSTVVEN